MAATLGPISDFEYNSSGQLIRALVYCDTVSDLPAVSYFAGYTLMTGSTAHIIDSSESYMLDSSGTWHQQLTDITADVYTKAQINTMLLSYATTAAMTAADNALQADINTKATDDSIFRGTWIPNNNDLNDYKTPGRYYTTSASGSATQANTPVTGSGFTMEVFTNLSTTPRNIMQKLTKISAIPTPFYIRAYLSQTDSWSAWYKFEGVPV